MNRKMKTKKRGAILLIAIMVSSVVLAVGFGIYQRTYKQILIGSFWKQIQVAFAAADAGLECAVYWDKHWTATPPYSGDASCFGASFVWTPVLPNYESGVFEYSSFYPGTGNLSVQNGCVEIKVTKVSDPLSLVNPPKWTYIDVAGYNDACTSSSPRRVNRIRWIKYKD